MSPALQELPHKFCLVLHTLATADETKFDFAASEMALCGIATRLQPCVDSLQVIRSDMYNTFIVQLQLWQTAQRDCGSCFKDGNFKPERLSFSSAHGKKFLPSIIAALLTVYTAGIVALQLMYSQNDEYSPIKLRSEEQKASAGGLSNDMWCPQCAVLNGEKLCERKFLFIVGTLHLLQCQLPRFDGYSYHLFGWDFPLC